MDEIYDILFNSLEFKNIRNNIFDQLKSNIEIFFEENKYNGPNDFLSKLKKYLELNSSFTYSNFTFKLFGDMAYFYHHDYTNYYEINNLKKFKISLNSDGSDTKEEWVFNDAYLKYLIFKRYKMKNPKIAHTVESINDESSISSLKENNIKFFMANDWDTIYEDIESIDLNEILEIKKTIFGDKVNKKFFINLIGLKEITTKLPKNFLKYKSYSSSFNDIFPLNDNHNKKTIIFHNEDAYFRFNLFQHLELYFNWGLYKNFYINFELLRDCKRKEKQERIAYFLSFLFPNEYTNFNVFYEERIKSKISDDLGCWPSIFNEIINYFNNNIFQEANEDHKIKTPEQENKTIDLNNTNNLFKTVNTKYYIIIFDNILTAEENKIVENILKEYSTSNFIFFIIYPLINDFTSKQFIKYVNRPYDLYFPFSLYFANITDFEAKSPEYNLEVKSKIFKETDLNNELIVYDLIRIFNFKSIFVDSINRDINCESLEFLRKYIPYLNIQFDNMNKKIINIAFKNKNIEKEFKDIYENTLIQIKAKNSILFNHINGQKDGFEIEKIIISNIIYRQKEEFEILEVKSIFGLKELNQKEKVNYKNSNFILEQKSSCGEMFDFGCKIIKDNMQYLKLGQVTSIKTPDEKEKLSIEKMKINCSYLQKELKKNKLGEIDGISFCIIAPLRIIETNNNSYKDLKKFCRENNYEFILFDLNKGSFYKREKGKCYDIDFFEIDTKFLLNIENFDEIITINKPIKILSVRKVKDRDEDEEDINVKNIAKDYIDKNIKRIAKFEYIGSFNDLTKLKEDYFAYIYFQKKLDIYFYNNKIVKTIQKGNDDINKFSQKKLTLILYSSEIIHENYFDSSNEIEEDKNNIIISDKNIENKEESIEINEEESHNTETKDNKKKSFIKTQNLIGRKKKKGN